MADVEDTTADHIGRHRLDALGDHGLLAGGDVSLAPAMRPVLGLDAAEQQLLRAAGAENKAFDARDLHGGLRAAALSSGSVGRPARSIKRRRSRRTAGAKAETLSAPVA